MICSLVDEAERAATAFETIGLGQWARCLFESRMPLTSRVLLSTANNECTRGGSRAASSKCRSRKCDENAEDLHVDNRESTRVDCCPAELKKERMNE
jgi:hypothetical protein